MKLHHLLLTFVVIALISFGCGKRNYKSVKINGQIFNKSEVLDKLQKQMTPEGFKKADIAMQDAFNAAASKNNPSTLSALRSVFSRGNFINGDLGTLAEDCVAKCKDDPQPRYCILKCHGF